MERYRSAIEAEVNRRLGRSEPPPETRSEIVRRFRTYCRLASISLDTARPSLDGLGGNSSTSLELAVSKAVEVACECDPAPEVAEALRDMESRFRTGVRRIMQPSESNRPKRSRKRRTPNAGKRVRGAIDRISDSFIALNLDTSRIFDVNPAAEALFGISAQKLLESTLSQFIAPQDQQCFEQLESRLDAGEESAPLELIFARPNGDFVPAQVAVANHMIAGKRLAIFTVRENSKALV